MCDATQKVPSPLAIQISKNERYFWEPHLPQPHLSASNIETRGRGVYSRRRRGGWGGARGMSVGMPLGGGCLFFGGGG